MRAGSCGCQYVFSPQAQWQSDDDSLALDNRTVGRPENSRETILNIKLKFFLRYQEEIQRFRTSNVNYRFKILN